MIWHYLAITQSKNPKIPTLKDIENIFIDLPKRISFILKNPQESRQEAAIILVILVLAIVLLIALFLLIVSLIDTYRRKKVIHSRARRKLTPKELLLRRLVIAFALLSLIITFFYINFSSDFCKSCHELNAAVKSWSRSTHARVPCVKCHSTPGITGLIASNIRGFGNLSAKIGLTKKSGNVYYNSNACLDCHEHILTEVKERTVRTRHKDFIEEGWNCSRCHKGVGHIEKKVFSMRYCLECHNDKKASAKCEICHVKDIFLAKLDEKAISQNFPKVPAGSIRCYNVCHPKDVDAKCTPCHGTEMPHPQLFIRRHAVYSYENRALCVRCHQENGATTARACGCHPSEGDTMHGTYEYWFIAHRTAAPLGSRKTSCLCHYNAFSTRDLCDFCHIEGSPLRRWQEESQIQ